jgi:hypothetical protein
MIFAPSNFRLALRRLMRSRGYTLVAILTLALALGAHVAIFGLVDVLFLRPAPASQPDRLVGVYEDRGDGGHHPLSYPDFLDYRERATSFEELAAVYHGAPLDLRVADESFSITGAVVSASYFSVLGLEPQLGRFFLAEDDREAGGSAVAVISHDLWQRRFAGSAGALGALLSVNGTDATVVGVAPREASRLRVGDPVELWIPGSLAEVGYRWCAPLDRDCTWLNLLGRLRPDRSIGEARAELETLSRAIRAAHPPPDAAASLEASSLDPAERGVLLARFTAIPVRWNESWPGMPPRSSLRRFSLVESLSVSRP